MGKITLTAKSLFESGPILNSLNKNYLNECVTGLKLFPKNIMNKIKEGKVCSQVLCSCLIASLIACVHGKVCSLSKSLWLVQPITGQSY